MVEWLTGIIPNVMGKLPELFESLGQTLYMTAVAGFYAFVIGSAVGMLLVVTRRGGILPNAPVFHVFDKLINVLRAIPFVILIMMLIGLTRLIVGTYIGTKGAIFPLVIGTIPFFARQIESALLEVDAGVIEAAQSMGSSPMDIMLRVYLRESVPGIVRAVTITTVSLIGLTAMAGTVGGGGLGDFALRYGFQRNQTDVTYAVVILLLLLISLIQGLGTLIIRKTSH